MPPVLHLKCNPLTSSHKRYILSVLSTNPTASLAELCDTLNASPALAACPIVITPAILLELGASEPPPPALVLTAEPESPFPLFPPIAQDCTLTKTKLRTELESTHARLRRKIDSLLDLDVIDPKQVEVITKLETADNKVRQELLELMHTDPAEATPQAIIILCMMRLGVSEEDILTIENAS